MGKKQPKGPILKNTVPLEEYQKLFDFYKQVICGGKREEVQKKECN